MPEPLRQAGIDTPARAWTVVDGGAELTSLGTAIGLIFCGTVEGAMALRAALAEPACASLRIRLTVAHSIAVVRALKGDVIVLDVDVRNPRELQMLRELLAGPPHAPVIVTSPSLDVESTCELVAMGARYIVPQPLSGANLAKALQQALTDARAAPQANGKPRGLVVSLIGSCGGVGTTSLAVQGACALSRLGTFKRSGDLCLLDFDVQFGCAALLLDAEQRGGIVDLIEPPERLDPELLRGAMVRAAGRFDLLSSPRNFRAIDDIDPDAVMTAVQLASSQYALTIIDLPTLWSHWTHATLRASDSIVLVVQPTVVSLRQGRRQIEMLREEALDDIPLFVVANRVAGGFFSSVGVPLKAFETALGKRPDHVIPDSDAMRAAAESGKPLSDVSGGGRLEKQLAAIFEAIVTAHPDKRLTAAPPP
jgi:pilus assembly protein CpaE